jgi:hypothetical protein
MMLPQEKTVAREIEPGPPEMGPLPPEMGPGGSEEIVLRSPGKMVPPTENTVSREMEWLPLEKMGPLKGHNRM